jgi:hypothetical protein
VSVPSNRVVPAAISKLPLGILGFLGIKNGGEYPREMAGFYQPQLELLSMLAGVHAEELHLVNNALPAAGSTGAFSTPLVVPNDQVWYVIAGGIRITTGAGEAWTGVVAIRQFGTASPNNIVPISDMVTVGASAFVNLRLAGAPIWLTPGTEVVTQTSTITGAPVSRPALRFARFQI